MRGWEIMTVPKRSIARRWVVVASLMLAVATGGVVRGDNWKVPARWNTLTDSTRMHFYKNGVLSLSRKRTTQQSYDTTFTVFPDTLYTVEYRLHFTGEDSATSWVWEYFDPTGVGIGAGSDTVVVRVVDTSGADTYIAGAKVTVRNSLGGVVGVGYTGATGAAVFHLDTASGTNRYALYAHKVGYIFPSDTFSVLSDIPSLPLEGYDYAISDASANTSRVYGYVFDVSGRPLSKADVTFALREPVNNRCDSTIMGRFSVTAKTDSTGLFIQDLVYSSCLGDTVGYAVTVTYKGTRAREHIVVVPNSPTYQVEW